MRMDVCNAMLNAVGSGFLKKDTDTGLALRDESTKQAVVELPEAGGYLFVGPGFK